MKSARQKLIDMNACQEAVEWVSGKGVIKAWNRCTRPDWMLWVAAKIIDRKLVVLAACDCVEPALQYVPKNEDRPRHAIETARALYAGKATRQDCRNAATAAYAAYAAADAAAAAKAAKAAAYAAYAAADAADAAAAYAAYAAADAAAAADAYAAYAAADAAAAADARKQANRTMCKLIRKRITAEQIKTALETEK